VALTFPEPTVTDTDGTTAGTGFGVTADGTAGVWTTTGALGAGVGAGGATLPPARSPSIALSGSTDCICAAAGAAPSGAAASRASAAAQSLFRLEKIIATNPRTDGSARKWPTPLSLHARESSAD
jgi:hypothetical protein